MAPAGTADQVRAGERSLPSPVWTLGIGWPWVKAGLVRAAEDWPWSSARYRGPYDSDELPRIPKNEKLIEPDRGLERGQPCPHEVGPLENPADKPGHASTQAEGGAA